MKPLTWLRRAAVIATVAVAGAALPGAAGAVTLSSHPPSAWGAAADTLGFTNPTVEDFEDLTLVPGLSYAVTRSRPDLRPSAQLANVFLPASDAFGTAFAPGAWDGTHVLIDTADNQSHSYTSGYWWGAVTFNFVGGATRVGFSLTDVEAANTLSVNGVPLGTIGQVPGTTSLKIASSQRNGYLVITAGTGERITSVTVDNNGNGDGWAIDHLLIERGGAATAARLFLTDDLANAIYRYEIGPATAPVLETTIAAPSANSVAIRSTGEMFVGDFAGNAISRFLSPFGPAQPNGRITGVGLTTPEQLRFVGDELWVVSSDLAGSTSPSAITRLAFDAKGAASVAGTISDGLVMADRGMLWNAATSELFVSQCCKTNTLQHYKVGPDGAVTRLGPITSPTFASPHGMVLTSWGELIVANYDTGTLSRLLFDAKGNAVDNGSIEGNGVTRPVGLALSPWGELFVANADTGLVSRFAFDADKVDAAMGTFKTPAGPNTRLAWSEIAEAPIGCAPPTSPACRPQPAPDGGTDGGGVTDAATQGSTDASTDAAHDAAGDRPADAATDAGQGTDGGGGCGCDTGGARRSAVALALLALLLVAGARRRATR